MSELPFAPSEVLSLLGIPILHTSRDSMYIDCPVCGGKKKLNIVLYGHKAHMARCAKCSWSGNSITLYKEFTNSDNPYSDIMKNLNLDTKPELAKTDYAKERHISSPLASAEIRAKAFSAFFKLFHLEDEDKQNLLDRGLSEKRIIRNSYRTIHIPNYEDAEAIATTLQNQGHILSGVQGFYTYNGKWSAVKVYHKGFSVPYLDRHGDIQGFQIRVREITEEHSNRYYWYASRDKQNGVGSPCFVHYATRFAKNPDNGKFNAIMEDTLFVTEGALKADIFHYFTNKPCLAISGVNCQEELIKELEAHKKTVKNIVVAFDMDYLTNEYVVKAEQTLKEKILALGYTYYRLTWDENFKGIDDYCASNKGLFNIKKTDDKSVLKCVNKE